MAESIIEQSKSAKGAKRFLKNKLFIFAVFLLGGGALLVCLPQLKFLGTFVHVGEKEADRESSAASEAPDRDPDIVGMVEAVSGNEITVLEFDPDTVDVPMTGTQNAKKSTTENALSLGQTSSMPSGGGMPGGGPGGGYSRSSSTKSGSSSTKSGSSGAGSSSSNRETVMAELKSASTGKQKIIVPIGISILKAASTDTGIQKEDTSFTDLTSDTIVKVWLKKTEDGKSVAEFVDITGKVNMSNSNN